MLLQKKMETLTESLEAKEALLAKGICGLEDEGHDTLEVARNIFGYYSF